MAKCSFCGTTILFGGVKDEGERFCNDKCHRQGLVAAVSRELPESEVRAAVATVHQGACPQCDGQGPVDVFVSYRVWSAILLTTWINTPQIGCRKCGVKSQLGDTVFSLIFGWWGIPWGFIMTPVQIGRNLVAMGKKPDPYRPSEGLEEMVRVGIGAQLLAEAQAQEQAA